MVSDIRVAVLAAGLALALTGCQRAAQRPQPQPAAEPMEGQVVNVVAEGVTMHGEHTTETFKPGVIHEVEVELKPGTYPVSCNVPGHKEAGMVATIIAE